MVMDKGTRLDAERELLLIAQLLRMGFDISRLEFYRWLVEHGCDPEVPALSARRPGSSDAVSCAPELPLGEGRIRAGQIRPTGARAASD